MAVLAGGCIARLQNRSWSFTLFYGVVVFLVVSAVVTLKSVLSH